MMPNRYLRASYIDSRRINALSAEAERMFCRLLVHVDDFGRCEACPDLLRGKLFARQLDKVTDKKVQSWVEELAAQKLLFLYVVGGQTYIQMNTWEQGRAKNSKCPAMPTDANKCLQVYARENISPDSDSDSDSDTDKSVPDCGQSETSEIGVAHNLARKLMVSIATWKPDFAEIQPSKANRTETRWAKDIDLALRVDKRKPEDIEAVIAFLPQHEGAGGFRWREQILSGHKLREKFDKLQIAMNQTRGYKCTI